MMHLSASKSNEKPARKVHRATQAMQWTSSVNIDGKYLILEGFMIHLSSNVIQYVCLQREENLQVVWTIDAMRNLDLNVEEYRISHRDNPIEVPGLSLLSSIPPSLRRLCHGIFYTFLARDPSLFQRRHRSTLEWCLMASCTLNTMRDVDQKDHKDYFFYPRRHCSWFS